MMRLVLSIIGITLILALPAGTEESADGKASSKIEKAVSAFDLRFGMKFTSKALTNMGLRLVGLTGKDAHRLPVGSLVHYQDKVGVYRLRDGWFKLIPVSAAPVTKLDAMVSSTELRPGDQVVTSGAAFLRLAELDIEGGAEDND